MRSGRARVKERSYTEFFLLLLFPGGCIFQDFECTTCPPGNGFCIFASQISHGGLILRIDANIFIKHNFLLQTKDKMQNTMLHNTDPKREFAEAKGDDYKPYLYLTPTSFVEKFLGIADIEDIILAEENEPLIDLNESLWISYDSDFVKNDKFNENI